MPNPVSVEVVRKTQPRVPLLAYAGVLEVVDDVQIASVKVEHRRLELKAIPLNLG
jgi:hypothetical protein